MTNSINRKYIKFILKTRYPNKKIPMPIKSKQSGYIICPECGQGFSSRLSGIEEYARHYVKEHN